jgi:hypothetical protein
MVTVAYVECSNAEGKVKPDVTTRKVVCHRGVISGLENTNHESERVQLSLIFDESMGDGEDTPADHECRDPEVVPNMLPEPHRQRHECHNCACVSSNSR